MRYATAFRLALNVFVITLCISSQAGLCGEWQELLDRADSLVTAGHSGAADAIVDSALSRALTEYGKSDTTVSVDMWTETGRRLYYFRSYAEAESIYSRVVSLKEKTTEPASPEVADILINLGELLWKQDKISEAAETYERVLRIREEALGPGSPQVASVARSLGLAYETLGEHEKSESLYVRGLRIEEKEFGRESAPVAMTLTGLGKTYMEQGRYSEAESLLTRALVIAERVLGPEHEDVGETAQALASVYREQGEYDDAEPLLERALKIREAALGPVHMDVASSLHGLATLNRLQGQYADSEARFKRAISIWTEVHGPEHLNVGIALGNMASLYNDMGRYSEAEQLNWRSVEIYEKVYGADHIQVASRLHAHGAMLLNQSRFSEAEPVLKRALVAFEKALDPEHPHVGIAMNGLAALYGYQGKYSKAQPLFERTLCIWEKAYGPEHPYVAAVLDNLGGICTLQGKYLEAEAYFLRALALEEKTLGPQHPTIAGSLTNLAVLYSRLGRYEEAQMLSQRAVDIARDAHGEEHPAVATSLMELAGSYKSQGKCTEAEPLYRQALRIAETVHGPQNPDVAVILFNLALCREDLGYYDSAKELQSRALAIREESLGPDHYYIAESLESLCLLHRLRGDLGLALQCAHRAHSIRRSNFVDNAIILSEGDALGYSQFLRECTDMCLACYCDVGSGNQATVRTTADIIISSKGQVSDGIFERQRSLVEEGDSTAKVLSVSLCVGKSQLSNAFVQGPGEDAEAYREEVDSLTRLIRQLEDDLAEHSASFRRRQDLRDVRTTRVASLLPENSVLVEYVKYEHLEPKTKDTSARYLALIVNVSNDPLIVRLGEASEIDALVEKYREHISRVAESGVVPTAPDQQDYRRIARDLYARIWLPIEDHVVGEGPVLVAPDGALNLISFAGLVGNDGAYLVESMQIHYLASGRDLIRLKDDAKPGRGMFALGDPDYDATVRARSLESLVPDQPFELTYALTRNVRSGCGSLKDMKVGALPGTRREVALVVRCWEEAHHEPVKLCLGPEASEERFKAEATSKRVIHLATHGYFLEGVCQPERSGVDLESGTGFVGENPLLLSGLFLAGANTAAVRADSLGAEDGILTAYEVSAMDLSGAEMVVLSACETGLGRVAEGEGVYGLRRAFQMAGARTVVSALWPVPDEVTAEMMSQLYTREDESIPETMRRVQLLQIEQLRAQGLPDHPYTWAGFIALGDWR